MKAIICPKYGPAEVLRIELREDPEPREDEVLINIRAASVTNSDLFIRSSKVDPMLLIPMRLMIGFEEATGAAYGGGKARSSKLKEACARAYRGRPLRLYRRRGLGLRFRGHRRGPQVRRVGAQAGERRGQGKLTL